MDEQWTWQSVCPPRVLRSLFAGAAAGGVVSAMSYVFGTALSLGPIYVLRSGLLAATGIFVAAFVVWTLGLIAFGIVPWWIFHRIGFRNLVSALVLGFSMAFLIDLAFASHLGGLFATAVPSDAHEILRDASGVSEVDYVLTSHGWRTAVQNAAQWGAQSSGGRRIERSRQQRSQNPCENNSNLPTRMGDGGGRNAQTSILARNDRTQPFRRSHCRSSLHRGFGFPRVLRICNIRSNSRRCLGRRRRGRLHRIHLLRLCVLHLARRHRNIGARAMVGIASTGFSRPARRSGARFCDACSSLVAVRSRPLGRAAGRDRHRRGRDDLELGLQIWGWCGRNLPPRPSTARLAATQSSPDYTP